MQTRGSVTIQVNRREQNQRNSQTWESLGKINRMLRPTRVELVERLKKVVGLKPGEAKTVGYLSRKDITELIAFAEEVKAEKQGHTGA